MIAEIISIGTELLLGETIDTNSTFLANELKEYGVSIFFKTTVGDNPGRLQETISQALERSDLVITSGGLGPTDGDITRESIAEVLQEQIQEIPELVAHLEKLFLDRGRSMPSKNRKQATLIPSAEALPNAVGTAPGWLIRKNGKMVIALPGPPHEMKRMWQGEALPRLNWTPGGFFHVTFHTLGLGESQVVEKLSSMTRQANPSVATYARPHALDVRVAAGAATREEAERLAIPFVKTIEEILKPHIYGRDEDSLPGLVGRLLVSREEKLAVFEGFTGGAIASLLTDVPECHRFFGEARVLGTPVPPGKGDDEGERIYNGFLFGQMETTSRPEWTIMTSHMITTGTGADSREYFWIGCFGPGVRKFEKFDWMGDKAYLKVRSAYWTLMILLRALRVAP